MFCCEQCQSLWQPSYGNRFTEPPLPLAMAQVNARFAMRWSREFLFGCRLIISRACYALLRADCIHFSVYETTSYSTVIIIH